MVGLHLRSIEQPHSRMPTEQGGTTSVENVNARSGVPLPSPLQLPSCQTTCEYDAEYSRMEAWMDENPEFIQDYFIRLAHFTQISMITQNQILNVYDFHITQKSIQTDGRFVASFTCKY